MNHLQQFPFAAVRWHRWVMALALIVLAAILWPSHVAYAATITVNTTADEFGTGASCSLREAIQAANTNAAFGGCTAGAAGTDTITLPAGTYTLSITGQNNDNNATGDLDVTESLTINGADQATTIIDGNNTDAILDTFAASSAVTVNLNNLTLQHGNPTGAGFESGGAIYVKNIATLNLGNVRLLNNTANLHGGAIYNEGTVMITNSTFSGNQANGFGGALYNAVSTASASEVNNGTFSNNQAEYGGAIYTNSNNGINLTVADSTFTGNQALDRPGGPSGDFGDGAAIYADTDADLMITRSKFLTNSAARNGGAVFFKDSTTQTATPILTMLYNRIVGNTATSAGSGVYANSGTVTIENNWWGCNAGPSSAPCDRVSGTADFDPWMTLTHTANPNPIVTGGGTTLTASFLTNSDGNGVNVSNIGAFVGLPVTFDNAVLGSLSGAQATIQTNGRATATFTAGGTPGAGSADATVDSQTTTAAITIQTPPDPTPPDTTITNTPANPTNSTSANFSFTGTDNVTAPASLTFTCQIDGGGFSACTSPKLYTGLSNGSHTFQVRATDQASNTDPTPASFTWTVDTVAPTVTINQAGGQADPTSNSPINFTATFNESVSGFTGTDVSFTGSTVGGTLSAVVTGGPTTYNVAVSGMVGNGTVIASIPGNSATDTAGNGNAASTSTDNTVTFFTPAPEIDLQGNGQSIAAGDTTPTVADDTDFGKIGVTSGSVVHTFTISNTGNANLLLTGTPIVDLSDATHFSVSMQPAATTIAPGGSITFAVTFDPAGAGSHSAVVSIANTDADENPYTFTVQGIGNSPPVATANSYNTNEDTPLSIAAPGVLGNDNDADGSDTLVAILVSDVSSGTLTLNSNGSFTYTPNANVNGSDSFTYKANDGTDDSNTVTVTLTIAAVNDVPVATIDSYSTNEDTPLTVSAPGVLDNDSDVDGDALTAILVSDVSSGTLTLNSNGSFGYTPSSNVNGSDSFTYKANDGTADSNTVTVTLTITPVNDIPVATVDSYSTNEDTPLTVLALGVLGNDSDVEGDPLTAVLVTDVSSGTLTLSNSGSFTYTPAADFNGSDRFTYKANDGVADSNTVTVTLTITPVNDAPVATVDSYSTNEDIPLVISVPGVLGNDSDVDGSDTLTAALVSNVSHGTLTLNSHGAFTYTPAANFNGSDSFTYKANDGTVDSNTVSVTLTIHPVNDAPVAVDDNYSTETGVALTIPALGVLLNDNDIEGSPLSALLVSSPAHGTLTLNANGSFTYTPNPSFAGNDSFTYRASDGTTTSPPATVTIKVLQPVILTLPSGVAGTPGSPVTLPLTLTTNGNGVAAAIFSVDYAESCLTFDATDANTDGIPDAVVLALPTGFTGAVSFDGSDTDGELDFLLSSSTGTLSDGLLARVTFGVSTAPACAGVEAAVNFATEPLPSFGTSTGSQLPGHGENGSVAIGGQSVIPGNCNGDQQVDAGDLTALVLEIFDGDGSTLANVSSGSFMGTQGCDANGDTIIDAGDISCVVLLIFNGPGACGSGMARDAGGVAAQLTLPTAVESNAGDVVTVPVHLQPGEHQLSAALFALTFDPQVFTFDPTDGNGDGIADAVTLVPLTNYTGSVTSPHAGRVEVAHFAQSPDAPPLTAGAVATITLTVNPNQVGQHTLTLIDSSLGDATGRSVAVTLHNGDVVIVEEATQNQIYLPFIHNEQTIP